jgi:tripartite-type tricarboxylate transporter receptor subunit TctC
MMRKTPMTIAHPTRRRALQAAVASTVAAAWPAWGQAWPARPIRLICPWPAGGATDAVMRTLADSAGKALGGQFVVENKPGASGTLGANELVGARPDGYTLSQIHIGVVRQPHLQKMQFDPLKDFTYVACLTGYTFGLVVRSDSPIKTLKDMVDYAKANPGKFTYGSPGSGTTPHFAVEEFAFKAGIKLQHVPFKGFADGMQSMLGGHTMSHSDSTGWASHVDAGTARLLATYGSKRTRRWPQVATLQELGYETVSDSPYGIGAPKGMEPAVTRRLQDAFRKTLEDPAVLAAFEKYDQSVIYMNTDDYTRYMTDQFQAEKALMERIGLLAKN